MTETDTYELCCEFEPAHNGDVKSVLAISDNFIASASRDSSVGVWERTGPANFELKALLDGHHAYVNSLAFIPSDDNDCDASGGNSSLILLHSLKTLASETQDCLTGHILNVCTLSYSVKRKKLISGSWDQTARVWSRSQSQWGTDFTLEGHDAAVWGVAVVEEGQHCGCYLTADRTINLWDDKGQLLSRFKGSPEPVRSIVILPGMQQFASACNDNLVRIWDFDGAVVERLIGHTDYVYQVTLGENGVQLVSCGEDHTARFAQQDIRDAYMQRVKEAMPNDDAAAIPLTYQIGSDPRTAAEAFGQEHSLSENYINQIEAFIKAHLDAAKFDDSSL
ncbi:uncharacterized protein IL334_005908 [Kwoniella shivajii]|uniref:Uncharacterized protein n=1 Tax=Kwoniella shivajii TaxID=564305 RepID=A0ABZ1D505_9TREE|nr:hypothetical protein IL334_005908 [Kwoniella shivajii]